MIRALAPLLLLAACAGTTGGTPSSAPEPQSVTLYRDTVTVEMNDGTLCAGLRPGAAGPWRTRLAGCPHPWPVAVLRPTERPRLSLAPATGAPWVTLAPPGGATLGYGPRVGS